MAKFGIGDTVVGNTANNHGVTGEDCVVIITKLGATTFSGIIDYHPDDEDYEGTTHEGLRYEWFNLEDSVSDITESKAPSKMYEHPKAFKELDWVTIKRGHHKESTTSRYEDKRARVLSYDRYTGLDWIIGVLFDDNSMVDVWESELAPYSYQLQKPVTLRVEDGPSDVKIWGRTTEQIIVAPAHKKDEMRKETVPIKTHYVPTPSFDNSFDIRKTRKKGHIRLTTD